MNCPKLAFQNATENFLQKFDVYWNDAINAMGVQGMQLSTGNRLRPQICLWGYLATVSPNTILSHDYSTIANVAVSIEMVHKASLLIDDWIDNDSERHGNPTFHVEHGPKQAILSALNMIGNAMERLENAFHDTTVLPHNYYLCLNTIIKTVCSMAKGALFELQLQDTNLFNLQKIREITQLETAEILGNSLLLGYYAGANNAINPNIEKAFKEIGDKCGYLFQAFNDLEAFISPEKLIKHKGSLNFDYQSNRKNLAIAALFEIARAEDQDTLREADWEIIMQMMDKYCIVDTMHMELDNVFLDLIEICDSYLVSEIHRDWRKGFQGFLACVKKFAEARLK